MTKKLKSNQAEDKDQNILKTNSFLETQKEHKEWYQSGTMGKQRGMPQWDRKKVEKPKGTKKYSLRKETKGK